MINAGEIWKEGPRAAQDQSRQMPQNGLESESVLKAKDMALLELSLEETVCAVALELLFCHRWYPLRTYSIAQSLLAVSSAYL